MKGLSNEYDLRFSVGIERGSYAKFKSEIDKIVSQQKIKIRVDGAEIYNLRGQLEKGLDTTVRIHVDNSELKKIAESYKMNFAQQPLTVDDFIANSTVDKFTERVNALRDSSKELVAIENKLRDFSKKAANEPLNAKEDAVVKQLKSKYANIYKEVRNSIVALSGDKRFTDIDSVVDGMIKSDADRLKQGRFRSVPELTNSISRRSYLDGVVKDVYNTEKQYLESAKSIKAELDSFATNHNIADAVGVNELSLNELSEAVNLMNQLKAANDKLVNVGAQNKVVKTPEWYDEYERALKLQYSRGQEIQGQVTTDPSVGTYEAAKTAITNLKNQIESGLTNVKISSFDASSAVTTLKESLENHLSTIKIGRVIRFSGAGGQNTSEDQVVLSDVQVGHFTITTAAQQQLVNDVNDILSNVTMHLNTDESTLAQAIENVNLSYQRKLSRLVNSINTRLQNPVIKQFDAQEAIKKLAKDIQNGINHMKFKINGQVAEGTIPDTVERLRYGSLETMSTGLTNMITKANRNISSLRGWGALPGAAELTASYDEYLEKLRELRNKANGENGITISLVDANHEMEKLITKTMELGNDFEKIKSKADLKSSIDKALAKAKDNVTKMAKYTRTAGIDQLMSEYGDENGEGVIGKLQNFSNFYNQPVVPVEQMERANEEAVRLLATVEQMNERFLEIGREDAIANAMRSADREANSLTKSIATLQKRMDKSFVANSKGFSQERFRSEYNEIYKELTESTDLTTPRVQALSTRFTQLEAAMTAVGATGKSTGEVIRGMFKKFGGWAMVTSTVHRAYMVFMRMYTAVKDVDTALTNLRKVTDATEADLQRFMKNVGDSAHKMGSSMSDLVNATAEFSRLGYDLTQSQKLGELATMYKSVAEDLDITTASQSIVSTLKAFEKAGISAERIVDVFNYVGNNFAISSAGIGEAMQRSAASLQTANNSLEQSVALITAANEVAQDPIKVGTAMKTLSARIRGSKSELTELGEDIEFLSEGTSKLRNEIKALSGVDIMIDDTTFKSTYQIIDELSVAYQGMVETSQARLAEMLGGKNQANIISALLENFDTARKALKDSTNEADGSAAKELATALDSVNGKLNQLSATWQKFSNDVLQSDLFKTAITVIDKLINGLDKLIGGSHSLLKITTAIFAAYSISKNQSGLGEPENQKVLIICPEFMSRINNRLYVA